MTDLIPKIKLRSILLKLGFTKSGHHLQFNFGNGVVSAFEYIDIFSPVFQFIGSYRDERTASFIDFKVPAEVESFDQGVAFLSYYFRNDKFLYEPSWLKEGLELSDHLPWRKEWAEYQRREKERREYEVLFDYDLFKVLVKKLKTWYEYRPPDSTIQFFFDGEIMRIQSGEDSMLIGGKGKAWLSSAVIETAELEKLPKRVLRSYAEIILHKEALYLCLASYRNIEYSNDLKTA
jgi:hypothetical protein